MLSRIRNYLQILGQRVDDIVFEHEEELYKQESMTSTCIILIIHYVLASYVSSRISSSPTFIVKKLYACDIDPLLLIK